MTTLSKILSVPADRRCAGQRGARCPDQRCADRQASGSFRPPHPLVNTAYIGQSESVEVDFAQLRDDGTVDARLGPEWPIFNEALADSISSLPPRGSAEKRLSTYWIDKTLERLRSVQQTTAEGRIASGNAYGIV